MSSSDSLHIKPSIKQTKQLSNSPSYLDELPSSLFEYCCSFLPFEIKVLHMIRLNKRIKRELTQSRLCHQTDALQFSIDSQFDSALIANTSQSIHTSASFGIDHQFIRRWIISQLSIPYLPYVRSISATYRIVESLKKLSPATINQFCQSIVNLKTALLNSTLRSLLIHECDSNGSLKQGVIAWLLEQLVHNNESIKLQHLTLKMYSSTSKSSQHIPISFHPLSWKWNALSLMTSLKGLHLTCYSCSLPIQTILDSLPCSLTRFQLQLSPSHESLEWQSVFSSPKFLPLLEHLDINRLDHVTVVEMLANTIMEMTGVIRPIRYFMFYHAHLNRVHTFTRFSRCHWQVPIVLNLDVSINQFLQYVIPCLETNAFPVFKCFMISISTGSTSVAIDITKLLVLLAKREIHALSIDVSGMSIESISKEGIQALTKMPLLTRWSSNLEVV